MMIDTVGCQPPVIECVEEMILQAFPVIAFHILPARDPSIVNRLFFFFENLCILTKCLACNRFGGARQHVHNHPWRFGYDIVKDKLHGPDRKKKQHQQINRQQDQVFDLNTDEHMRSQKKPDRQSSEHKEKQRDQCGKHKAQTDWGSLNKDN